MHNTMSTKPACLSYQCRGFSPDKTSITTEINKNITKSRKAEISYDVTEHTTVTQLHSVVLSIWHKLFGVALIKMRKFRTAPSTSFSLNNDTPSTIKEVLVLGAGGSGKTLAIRRLQEFISRTDIISHENTIPTVGTEMTSIVCNETMFSVREVGYAMSNAWPKYLQDASALIYVIDVADTGSWATSSVHLLELLQHEDLADKPVLLLINKVDLADNTARVMIQYIMHIDELCKLNPQITVLYGTSLDEKSSERVATWISTNLTCME